eukprot:TRINITY_DN70128_c0_g1_i1.p1 TRINITY_DN70128_c0_g1~~TRINITY_DN70128_c0_g1_i1.p1  ORF type:complete len:247 (-),score=19.07 TRINITY_DN70128_c0_g1_i1:107-847(-)
MSAPATASPRQTPRSALNVSRSLEMDEQQSTVKYPSTTALSTKPTAPAFSFGGRLKAHDHLEAPKTPGPGSYYEPQPENLAKYSRVPKFSFGSASRQDSRRPRVPGPGAYVQKPFLGNSGPTFSCTPRRTEVTPIRGKVPPGPGAHDLPTLFGKNGTKPTMTQRRPPKVRPSPPGPGAYDTTDDSVVGSRPKWGFGSSSQRPKALTDSIVPTPGPGAYKHDTEASRGLKFSFRARTAGTKERLVKF